MDAATKAKLAKLADPARVHAQLAKDSKQARDSALWEAYQAGAGLRELAEASGLSVSTVHRAVVAEDQRRQVVEVEP
jgi:hypothetical protein